MPKWVELTKTEFVDDWLEGLIKEVVGPIDGRLYGKTVRNIVALGKRFQGVRCTL